MFMWQKLRHILMIETGFYRVQTSAPNNSVFYQELKNKKKITGDELEQFLPHMHGTKVPRQPADA